MSADQPAVVVVREHNGAVVSSSRGPGSVVVRERSGAVTVVAATKGPAGTPGAPGAAGPQGPMGPQGQWDSLTQAEFAALSPPNPDTLYVIIG